MHHENQDTKIFLTQHPELRMTYNFHLSNVHFLQNEQIYEVFTQLPIVQDLKIKALTVEIDLDTWEKPPSYVGQMVVLDKKRRLEIFMNLIQIKYLRNVFKGFDKRAQISEVLVELWLKTEIAEEITALSIH